ncbi:MAG TPA: branched-chain amino acid ABC transporter substrate-binding protein [Acetobacteraceae bacterium]|jgi:branched-chain amino acid transport system substrate-binding protein|nr:branched-chain amino acid ABC transporter substrate-binding protein [Acetobacteraceae bacterium]
MFTRRAAAQLFATTALAAGLGAARLSPAFAAAKVVKIGVDLSLTGADAQSAIRVKNAITMAFDAANQANAVPGYQFDLLMLDDGTATAGQYDPAQAATNARRMVADKEVVAALGPEMSGAGKAMTPILSQGNLATITMSSTNPDITNPKFAAQFRPAGKAIYFRTVTTDAYQGPNMANFYAEKLKVKSVYILDDSGAFGVGVADTFQAEAEKKGLKVIGRDRLDPKAADYTAILTKIKSLNPDSIYYGGVSQAGVKLAKQSYDIMPKMIRGGPDGTYGADFLTGGGFPAVEGWYSTIAAPHLTEDNKAAQFVAAYKGQFGMVPDDYCITAYDAALVLIDAVKRIAASGKPVTREAVQAALLTSKVPTIQGVVSFDANGDLADRTVSVFQITKDTTKPLDDPSAQYKYLEVAPQS